MGIGRAVYESTNKAIFADMFPGPEAPGAFANVFVFGTLASVFTYILGISAGGHDAPKDGIKVEYNIMYWCLIIFAAITTPFYSIARFLKGKEDTRTVIQRGLIDQQ